MIGLYVMFGIILLFATVLVVIDTIGRRQQRKSGKG